MKNSVSIIISLVKIARKSLLKYSLIIAFSEKLWFHRKNEHFVMKIWSMKKSCKILPFWQIPFETFCPKSLELLIVQKSTFYPQILMDLTYWKNYSICLYLQPFSWNFRKTECHFFTQSLPTNILPDRVCTPQTKPQMAKSRILMKLWWIDQLMDGVDLLKYFCPGVTL